MDLSVAVIELAGRADEALAELLDATDAVEGRIWGKAEGTVPERRGAALAGCSTEALLLIEDTVRLTPGWLSTAHAIFDDASVGAASGPVQPGPDLRDADRAWALHEYAGWAHVESGAPPTLPGHLLLLRVDAAQRVVGQRGAVREDELFPALTEAGFRLSLQPGLAATLVAADPGGARLRGQLHHGRGWAARERARAHWGRGQRLLRVVGWPVSALIRSRAALDGRPPAPVVGRVAALSSAWAIGEAIGAVFGAGSEEHWS